MQSPTILDFFFRTVAEHSRIANNFFSNIEIVFYLKFHLNN